MMTPVFRHFKFIQIPSPVHEANHSKWRYISEGREMCETRQFYYFYRKPRNDVIATCLHCPQFKRVEKLFLETRKGIEFKERRTMKPKGIKYLKIFYERYFKIKLL